MAAKEKQKWGVGVGEFLHGRQCAKKCVGGGGNRVVGQERKRTRDLKREKGWTIVCCLVREQTRS